MLQHIHQNKQAVGYLRGHVVHLLNFGPARGSHFRFRVADIHQPHFGDARTQGLFQFVGEKPRPRANVNNRQRLASLRQLPGKAQ